MKKLSTIAIAAFLILTAANFGMAKWMQGTKTSAAFEKLKTLVGTWTGTVPGMEDGKPMPVTVTYELTAGGSAIAEREFVGTPKEMLTVYYPENNSVGMTHYCMLGNQPHMHLKSDSGNTLSFEMPGKTGMMSKTPHMHALKLTLIDKDHLQAEWTEHENGKTGHVVVMDLTRKS